MRKTKISISIDKTLLRVIEKDRGLVDRSSYIEDLVHKQLRAQGKITDEPGPPSLRSAYR